VKGQTKKIRKHFLQWTVLGILLLSVLICIGILRNSSSANSNQIELRVQGETTIQLTDPHQVNQLTDLIHGAKALCYEPKTWFPGPELVLIGFGTEPYTLELDLDSDLFRYDGLFYDYGPGNDNNAIPKLLKLLGVNDWPDAVKAAFPDYFDKIGTAPLPPVSNTFPSHNSMIIGVWYPDWTYLELAPAQADLLLDALRHESPTPTDVSIPDVPATVFTLHIAFDGGKEFDLAYIGQTEFCIRDFQTNQVYTLSSETLRLAVEAAISETKESLYG
jgi:hypothetical protein